MAKIIIISDIHYSVYKHTDVYDAEHVSSELVRGLSEDYYDLLFSALEGEKQPADILMFCGDYVIGGENNAEKEKSMDAFVSFLGKIEASNKVLTGIRKQRKERIIIAPGNHDVIRGSKKIYSEFTNKLSRYCTPFSNTTDYPKAPTFIFDKLRLIIDCETTGDHSATTNQKIKEIVDLVQESTASDEQKESIIAKLEEEKILDIPSVSAQASIRFSETAKSISSNKKYDDYLKIILTHHPLISGIERGKPIKSYNTTIGGFDFMKSAMEFGYTLFIHGHIHQRSCIELTDFSDGEPSTAIQLGVPDLRRDMSENGIVVIDTDHAGKKWPFSVIYKKLDARTRGFKQTDALEGERVEPIYRGEYGMKILVDREITEIIDEGRIIINGDRDRVEAASYDCALGYKYKKSKSRNCDWSRVDLITLEASEETAEIVIEPQETILIYTYEEFDVPKNMVMHASPISSWLRKGLRVEISHLVDPGFKGAFFFPVINESQKTIKISSREPIMSIELIQLSQPCEKSWSERHGDKVEKRRNWED